MAGTTTDIGSPADDRWAAIGLGGGGAMGELLRSRDWSATPVGPPETWPQSLRTALSIVLASGYAMYIAWGEELTQFYNDAFRPILGASKHPAALGISTVETFAEIWEIIQPMFGRVMTAGEQTSYLDFQLSLDRNGYLEECYFDYSYSPVRDESGAVGGVFVTCSETTGRVVGDRWLATLRELGSASTGAASVAAAGEGAMGVLQANLYDLPWAMLYGVDPATKSLRLVRSYGLEGSPVLAEPPGAAADLWPLEEVVAGRSAVVIDDVQRRLGSFATGPWPEPVRRAMALPLMRTAQEEVVGVLVVGISPRRELDSEYRGFLELVAAQVAAAIVSARSYEVALERADALAQLDRAKTTFFSNISHEFRTPLTLALGPLEDLLSRPASALEESDRQRVELAHRNSVRLLRLVNSLLDFSRLEAGRIQAAFAPTDLVQMTRDLASAFKEPTERAGLALIVESAPVARPVFVDHDMWEKIVLNLLSNALKYTLRGSITVTVRPHGEEVELTVADTGVGIPEVELDLIFERFHRVQAPAARTHEGTGIGLALVKQLVDLHGGRISVRSVVGRGTEFQIRLPTGSAHLPPDQVAPEPPEGLLLTNTASVIQEALGWLPGEDEEGAAAILMPGQGLADQPVGAPSPVDDVRGARVLLVDDNRDMREYVSRLLGGTFEVQTAANGEEALEAVAMRMPDLILTDVMMPGIDGFELLRRLRLDPQTSSVPVIILSARAGEESSIEGLEVGADDYLTKPFAPRELVARIRANLRMARARSEADDQARHYVGAQAAHERALLVLDRIAAHLESTVELPGLFGAMTASVAELVQAEKVVFWLLDPEREILSAQRDAFGYAPEVVAQLHGIPCRPEGHEVADEIVFRDLTLMAADVDDARFTPYRGWLQAMSVRDVIATAWRASDERLGTLVAYDSRREGGFTEEDTWVLKIAALAAGLVWRFKSAERSLIEVRRRESEQLRDEVERVRRLEEMKSEFLRLASHELRGPIAVLGGYADILKSGALGPVTDRVADIYAIVETKVGEINRLVDQMLETARLDENQLELKLDDTDLVEVVQEAVRSVEPLVGPHHRLEVSLPPSPALVLGDSLRLMTVVRNLVENAVKYSPDGGDIRVELLASEGLAKVTVSDHGIGIAAEDLPRLFSRFGRIVNAENSHIPGTGLGLYVSRQIVRMHDGEITIESEPGVGTTARIEVPLVTDRRADAVPGAASGGLPEDSSGES